MDKDSAPPGCKSQTSKLAPLECFTLYREDTCMQAASPFNVAEFLWLVFALYWLISARKLKTIKQREPWYGYSGTDSLLLPRTFCCFRAASRTAGWIDDSWRIRLRWREQVWR